MNIDVKLCGYFLLGALGVAIVAATAPVINGAAIIGVALIAAAVTGIVLGIER